MTFVLGLTGGIATGKSTVSHYFKEQGVSVIDADVIAREVVEPGTVGLTKITEEFGGDILLEDGTLNRRQLGSIVFNQSEKLAQLNNILGIEIRQEILKQIEAFKQKNTSLVVVDIPLLYESRYETLMTKVMVVYIPEALQLTRLMHRDDLDLEQANKRIESQWPIERKKTLGDYVIDNSHSMKETKNQVDSWLEKFSNA